MTSLKRIVPEARPIISDAFVRGEEELDGRLDSYIKTTDITADLERLREVTEGIRSKYSPGDVEIEAMVAEDLHRSLDLTRREAADLDLWRYLAIVEFPEFVRHRWPPDKRSPDAMREKFWGNTESDIYSHALHRIWWMAELTYDPDTDDYDLTREVLRNQTLANDIFDRWFARYELLTKICARVLLDVDASHYNLSYSKVIEDATTLVRQELSRYQLEAMTEAEIERFVESCVEDTIVELR